MAKETTAVCRLETALHLLKKGDEHDWFVMYHIALNNAERAEPGSEDQAHWDAVRTLIVIAHHGAPEMWTYMDKEWEDYLQTHWKARLH